ncbi:HNH endonuclease, partial [Streptomyces sp. 067-1]
NSDPTKGIEVITDGGGGKAVRVQFDDPVTGAPLTANIPYDARGLPIFDDVSKYTTSIDTKFSYSAQMAKATRDLRDAINSGKVDSSQFSENQLKQINSGQPKIDDYTWHHNAQSSPNNMQLIPAVVHDAVIHSGQKSLNSGK